MKDEEDCVYLLRDPHRGRHTAKWVRQKEEQDERKNGSGGEGNDDGE
jgi:hypothetical protein